MTTVSTTRREFLGQAGMGLALAAALPTARARSLSVFSRAMNWRFAKALYWQRYRGFESPPHRGI